MKQFSTEQDSSFDAAAPRKTGGLARYFVEHREVGWIAMVAVMLWGVFSYSKLAQQEDPKIPERRALIVTRFPGAGTSKIEQLVTRKLEKKIVEMQSVDEVSSQSRNGVSIIHIALRPASQAAIEQEWDKLRAKLREVSLPEGCEPAFLDTDFGNTITVLYALCSPPITDGEAVARANLIRDRLRESRRDLPPSNRAAVVAFFPPALTHEYRAALCQKFEHWLKSQQLGDDIRIVNGAVFALADFVTRTNSQGLQIALDQFARDQIGSETDLHPDFHPPSGKPLIFMGDEDPLPKIRASAFPRYSYRELEKMAEMVEDEVKQLPGAGRVRTIATVRETVYLFFSMAAAAGYQISPQAVMNAIASRNTIIPGGNLGTEGQNFPVQLSGEFADENEMMSAVIALSRGPGDRAMPVYLRDLFEVRRGYETPIPFKVDVLQQTAASGPLVDRRAVLLAVEMKDGSHIGRFDSALNNLAAKVQPRLAEGVTLLKVSDQPAAVTGRISQFLRCFIEAIGIVILVCLFLMDWHSALVVAAAIPLTIAMTLGGMHLFQIPLHQISIAALIIALGMLVDDPVVASDGINRELAAGRPAFTAAWLGPHKLRRAILYATVINIVAFLPLILLPGDKGAFIFALPVVVTLALVSSRIVSVTFVPLLGYYLLRGQKGLESGGEVRKFFLFAWVDKSVISLLPGYKRSLEFALQHPGMTVGLAYAVLAASLAIIPFLGQQFFPPAERNQMLIDIELPESASVRQTRDVCAEITTILKQYPAVTNAVVFSGGAAPRFYYNVSPREPGNFLAQILINTRSDKDVPLLLDKLRVELDSKIAGARCLVKQLEQGPPVEAPIQIRLSGEDVFVLRRLADKFESVLRDHGAYKVHDDLGRQVPALQIDIDQDRANTLGIDNAKVGQLASAAYAGLKVTELRENDHLIPVMIRLRAEDRNEAEKLRTLYVESNYGHLEPMDNFAKVGVKLEFATVAHFNQLRTATVKAYSVVGELPSAVLQRAMPQLRKIELSPGYKLELAGEEKELRESRSEMGVVMGVSLSLIALAMVLQFNSAVKPLVVMLTVPLGLIGALSGLAITDAAFGFMALLGLVSLAGVIVSHIIVLSDFIEESRAEGMELKQALLQAGLVRLRAVMATVLATVCGLVPLALTGGELWRPLTAVHIFGLLFATILTLVLLPALYFLFARRRWI